jgi:hypothetical protein
MANSYADYMRQWGELTAALAANPDLAYLEDQRALLEVEVEAFRQLVVRQANQKRQAQETSREIEALVTRSRDMATRLRDSIRGHYGRRAEMLVEYRLHPRRPNTSTPATSPGTEDAKPSAPGSTPARPAAPIAPTAPETDAANLDVMGG